MANGGCDFDLCKIPSAHLAQIYVDFDGTITRRDVLDDLIQRYSRDESWKEIEELWQAGRIGSKECLAEEFDLLDVSRHELLAFLDTAEIDPGLEELVQLCRGRGVPMAILSDSIDFFIRRILQRYGMEQITVRANALARTGDRWKLVTPWSNDSCGSAAAHCKCASVDALRAPSRQVVYVGDGRSDLCPARKARVVFAKDVLARSLMVEEVGFIAYGSLADVARVLRTAWTNNVPRMSVEAETVRP